MHHVKHAIQDNGIPWSCTLICRILSSSAAALCSQLYYTRKRLASLSFILLRPIFALYWVSVLALQRWSVTSYRQAPPPQTSIKTTSQISAELHQRRSP
ncbi:hypothetical protein M501DRAFT_699524 [Patellaria atrata CBS 101060]|uniref:Uncharacterized protein n=1 Tax=Patellaria atrata CBS 101060 TaxID=1346257 RepID=A0A9P4VQZ1_9PEZI|nr:hypothetical protein M501DRAFT_699524 [Patellaria atrata CBS 101060]